MITVATVQHQAQKTKEACLEKSAAGIKTAAEKGAQLVLLQELHSGHYFCQTADPANFQLAETIPGATTKYLSELAKAHGIVLVSSLFEKAANGIYYNTSVVFDTNGDIAGTYRKMHIPDDPGYYEKYYFTPGNLGFTPIQTSIGKLGVLVCWDQWFPEAARAMALAGADLLLYPTAIGFAPEDEQEEKQRQLDAWITVQRGHAIANSLPVITCNRVGFEEDPSQQTQGIQFWGNSFITGHQGELLARASDDQEEVLTAKLDLHRRDEVQKIWPYFRDRRIDAYDNLLEK